MILNEVISRNASTLNGAQEIFGQAADYVLANPNGISVNGGSFINTPNANLVVGRPELNDGKLQALSTRDANGQLTVQGQGLQNREGSINLIAPRIDSEGRLSARDQLNLTVGRNQVDFASGQVRQVDPASKTRTNASTRACSAPCRPGASTSSAPPKAPVCAWAACRCKALTG